MEIIFCGWFVVCFMVFKYFFIVFLEFVLVVVKKKFDYSFEDKVVVNGYMCELKEENVNIY